MKSSALTILLALALAATALTGCTLGPYVHGRDPALAVAPPCFMGDICAISFNGPDILWAADALRAAR